MSAMALTTSFSLNHLFPLNTHSQPIKPLHQSPLFQVTPKTTTTSSIFPRKNPSVPVATASLNTTPLITDSDSEPDADDFVDAFNGLAKIFTHSVVRAEHPFVIEGSKDLFLSSEDNESYYLRVDLPGVEKEGVNLWIQKDFLCIEGVEANKDPDYDQERTRKYQNLFSLPDLADCKIDEIKVQVKGGVLRVVIPKLKLQEKEGVVKLLVN